MIKYAGNKTLVATTLEHLNEVFAKHPNIEIMVSRKWADKWNAAFALTQPNRSLKVSVETADTKVNKQTITEDSIPYKTID